MAEVDAVIAGVARSLAQAFIYPVESVKTQLQTGKKRINGKVLANGLAPASTSAGIVYGVYYTISNAVERGCKNMGVPEPLSMVVSSIIGTVGSSLLKVPMAVTTKTVQIGMYPNIGKAAHSIFRRAGGRGLYTGLGTSLIEDIPEMVIKTAAINLMESQLSKNNKTCGRDVFESFLIGAVAGGVSAGATTPFDVIKTIMAANATKRPNPIRIAGKLMRNRGLSAFYAGVHLRALSQSIKTALYYVFYTSMLSVSNDKTHSNFTEL